VLLATEYLAVDMDQPMNLGKIGKQNQKKEQDLYL
jgi:hypothetical protein